MGGLSLRRFTVGTALNAVRRPDDAMLWPAESWPPPEAELVEGEPALGALACPCCRPWRTHAGGGFVNTGHSRQASTQSATNARTLSAMASDSGHGRVMASAAECPAGRGGWCWALDSLASSVQAKSSMLSTNRGKYLDEAKALHTRSASSRTGTLAAALEVTAVVLRAADTAAFML